MRAVLLDQYGDLERLKVTDVPQPKPKPGEVLIEVHNVSVNPVEWKIVEGKVAHFLPAEFPLIIGWDVAGVVKALGEGVSQPAVGEEVYGYCRPPVSHQGTFAEYCCFDAQHIVPKPKNLSFAQAAAIPLVGLTAWQAIVEKVKLKRGQSCLIHAGAGGVGSLALPIARHVGAWVATTASVGNHDYVRAIGADLAIDYHTTDFVEEIRKHHPDGVDFVYDLVGGKTLDASYSIVKKGGWLVSVVDAIDKERAKQLGIHAENSVVRPAGDQLLRLKELLELGKIPAPPIEEMELSEVVAALRKIKTEHTRGKIVLNLRV